MSGMYEKAKREAKAAVDEIQYLEGRIKRENHAGVRSIQEEDKRGEESKLDDATR